MRLTKQFVDALKPSSEEIFAWDSELKGFGVRVKPTGIKTYFLQYRNKQGRSRRYTLGRHGVFAPEEARKLARLRLADIQYGEDPAADRKSAREAPTMSELCERYLAEHSEPHKKPSSVREDRRLIVKRINPAIGALSVESVTRADVMKLQHAMRKTPYDANRMLATLSKMFNLAEAWGLRPDGTNPVRYVQRFPERKRDQFL
ncbi:MAG TPA: integrase arm-type DNA-binding domain-containing protein, partial [Parvibaculum sp.]